MYYAFERKSRQLLNTPAPGFCFLVSSYLYSIPLVLLVLYSLFFLYISYSLTNNVSILFKSRNSIRRYLSDDGKRSNDKRIYNIGLSIRFSVVAFFCEFLLILLKLLFHGIDFKFCFIWKFFIQEKAFKHENFLYLFKKCYLLIYDLIWSYILLHNFF